MLYGRLDELRERTSTRLSQVLQQTGGTPQARSERDAAATMYADRLAQLNAVEHGLCFGRLDLDTGERRYIGRLGIYDENADYEPLLMDWRAPAARPFYLATAASPDGVRLRRHIRTRDRSVTAIEDEILDLEAAKDTPHHGLASEAALMAALNAHRTGRMRDIVETIQAEQDRVIRAGHQGVLVVQGGPGTGKTAVALHRAAYLLYTHRRELSQRGVLIVGPNATFLRYISQVLPSLGETGVLLCTVGELYPGITARGTEPPEVAEIKGRAVMAEVIRAAVRDRQRVPEDVMSIPFEHEVLRLDRRTAERARERARRSRRLHNQAQEIFIREVINALARQVADRIGADVFGGPNLLDAEDLADIRRELREDDQVMAAIEELWPILTPEQLLRDLFADPDRIASAAPQLTPDEQALLHRSPDSEWTPADVPLLDEAAELLGEDDREARIRAERERQRRVDYAEGVLEIMSRDIEDDPEILMAFDLIDADELAERHREEEYLTVAERAAADRRWAFGHVIVDEAQELSPMAWRTIMRRCPSRSMTLVGDVAQTGALEGTSSWGQVLSPYVADRWRLEELTVNYRTPAEIMEVAAELLTELDPPLEPPRSVRATGVPPWRQRVTRRALPEQLAKAVVTELAEIGEGMLAVLAPQQRLDELGHIIESAFPDAAVGEHTDLDSRVVVLTVRQAKGLEFDSVIIVEPGQIVEESPRGLNDLYVALTRATQRLGVLHTGSVPRALRRLRPRKE